MPNDFVEWLTRLFQSKDVEGSRPRRKQSRSKRTEGYKGENDIKIGIEIFNSISVARREPLGIVKDSADYAKRHGTNTFDIQSTILNDIKRMRYV